VRDVAVIGAGPAGSHTARRLAERGFDVVMLEEHAAIGEPVHCTGLLGFDAFDEFDLPRHIILGLAEAARFWGAAGQSVTVRSHRARASVIDRAALDTALADAASRAGVEIRGGVRVESIRIDSSSVTIDGRGLHGPLVARTCVLACGANYRFHRALGLGVPAVFLQSAQLETAFPPMDIPNVEVQFGRDVAPGGFAWLVPFRRGEVPYARIGLMTESRSRERFSMFLRALSARVGADPDSIPAPRLKILPLGPVPRTYGDRVLAVGDAAGLVKPTTGGGIYYGLVSGELAASVLADGLASNRLTHACLRRYEARWRRRLGQEIRVGLAFRRIAARLSDDSIDSLIELARRNGITQLLQDTASFNWHRKAAIALLADSSVRKIVFKSWRGSPDLI
jgi:digeranylgeranylglycerophospholipid reductase